MAWPIFKTFTKTFLTFQDLNGMQSDIYDKLNTLNNSISSVQGVVENLKLEHKGPFEPAGTWALMRWADTDSNILKIRNLSNSGWIHFMDLTTGQILTGTTGVIVIQNLTADPITPAMGQIWFRTDI